MNHTSNYKEKSSQRSSKIWHYGKNISSSADEIYSFNGELCLQWYRAEFWWKLKIWFILKNKQTKNISLMEIKAMLQIFHWQNYKLFSEYKKCASTVLEFLGGDTQGQYLKKPTPSRVKSDFTAFPVHFDCISLWNAISSWIFTWNMDPDFFFIFWDVSNIVLGK